MRDALDTLRLEDTWGEEHREWLEASASFIKRVGRSVRPFGDVLVRYRISNDLEEIHWHKKMANGMWNKGELHVRNMTIVELHAPETANENGMWLRACCFGKLPVLDSSRPVNYAVYLSNAAANLDDRTPTTEWCITPRASHAIAAAAEWAASKVRIPCS
jgi:hypothetical protein